jgi:hypothetical protein
MLKNLKIFQKKKIFLYSFRSKNISSKVFNFFSITLFYVLNKKINMYFIIRSFVLLFLITNQRPFFIKALKNNNDSKISKGNIIGVKVNMQRKLMFDFYNLLIWQILPLLFFELKKANPILINLKDIMLFYKLKNFYSIFKNMNNLFVNFNFGENNFNKNFMLKKFLLIPEK